MVPFLLAAAALTAAPSPPADRLHAAAVLLAVEGDHAKVVRSLVASVLEDLRGPAGNGEYRWATWVAGGGPSVSREARVRAVEGAAPEMLRLEAEHASRIVVKVDKRRSLFSGNYPCTVTSVAWRCPAWSRGETALAEERRLLRGDRLAFELGGVCPLAEVEVGAVAEAKYVGDSELSVEVETGHLEDDPASPHYGAARTLADFLAASVSVPDERWAGELAEIARDLGHRPPLWRAELARIRRLLDGSERDRQRALELLDELLSGSP